MNPVKFYLSDPWLEPYKGIIESRINKCLSKERQLSGNGKLREFAMGHYYYGLHRNSDGWIFREWAPNAENIFLTGTFSGWKEKPAYKLNRLNKYGD
jgi:1,4-alpha-glucan branching enzyme